MSDTSGNELVMRQVDAATPVPGLPDRATRVMSWVGWHLFEIAGVTAPAVVAVTATPWAWAVSGVVGAGWTVHEVRRVRRNAAILAGRDLPKVTDQDADTGGDTGAGTVEASADAREVRDGLG